MKFMVVGCEQLEVRSIPLLRPRKVQIDFCGKKACHFDLLVDDGRPAGLPLLSNTDILSTSLLSSSCNSSEASDCNKRKGKHVQGEIRKQEKKEQPHERLELSTPGLQDQCSNH